MLRRFCFRFASALRCATPDVVSQSESASGAGLVFIAASAAAAAWTVEDLKSIILGGGGVLQTAAFYSEIGFRISALSHSKSATRAPTVLKKS
jgi:hypothetical protein